MMRIDYDVYSLKPISKELRAKGFYDNLPKPNCYLGKVFDQKLNCVLHRYRIRLNNEEKLKFMKSFRENGVITIRAGLV
jgi:hypothetical protein